MHWHLQRTVEVVLRNFQLKKKSDDYELFLGKSGKNVFLGTAPRIRRLVDWVGLVLKMNLQHLQPLFANDENVDNLIETLEMSVKSDDQSQIKEKVERNIGLLGVSGKIFSMVTHLKDASSGLTSLSIAINCLKKILEERETAQNEIEKKIVDFNIGTGVYLLTEHLSKPGQSISLTDFSNGLSKLITQTSAVQSTNYLKQMSYTFDRYFKRCSKKSTSVIDFQTQLCINTESEYRQIISILFLYINEMDKAMSILDTDYVINGPKNFTSQDDKIFKLVLLSTTIKHSLRQIDFLNTNNKDIDSQTFKNYEQILRYSQKANCILTIRKALQLIKSGVSEIFQGNRQRNGEVSLEFRVIDQVWCILSTLPSNTINIIKEEIANEALSKMDKLIKYLKLKSCQTSQKNIIQIQNDSLKGEKPVKEMFGMAFDFLFQSFTRNTSESITHSEFSKQLLLMCQGEQFILEALLLNLELAIVCLVNQDVYNNTTCLFSYQEEKENKVTFLGEEAFQQIHEKTRSITALMEKKFRKLAKIVLFVEFQINLQLNEAEVEKCLRDSSDIKEPTPSSDQDSSNFIETQLSYLESLFSVALFDKYQQSQLLISKGFTLAKSLLSIPNNTMQYPLFESRNVEIFKIISFPMLNRQNKQKLAQIMELTRTNPHLKGTLLSQLENLLFSSHPGDAVGIESSGRENSQMNIKQKLLLQQQKKMIEILNQQDMVRQAMLPGTFLAKNMKLKVIERSLKVRELFGLSFDYSLYMDKSQFVRRAGNILGLSDSLLEKYKHIKEKQAEGKQIMRRAIKRQKTPEIRVTSSTNEIEPPLSFRDDTAKDQSQQQRQQFLQVPTIGVVYPGTAEPPSFSIDQARQFHQLLESPRIVAAEQNQHQQQISQQNTANPNSQFLDCQQKIPSPEIAKGLMRSRQLGQSSTPREVDKTYNQMMQDMARLKSESVGNQNKTFINPHLRADSTLSVDIGAFNKKRELGNAKDDSMSVQASIVRSTKRKNSTRREIYEEHKEDQPKHSIVKVDKNAINQHRKGIMSMAPQSVGIGLSNVVGNKIQVANRRAQQSSGIQKSIVTNIKQQQALQQESKIIKFQKLLSKMYLRQAFNQVKLNLQLAQLSDAAPFNLMLIRKPLGESVKETQVQLQQPPSMFLINRELQPFEFVRIPKDQCTAPPQHNQQLPPRQIHQKKHHSSVGENTNARKEGSAKNNQRGKLTREQKRVLMKKFKTISDKIDKLKQEAEMLNSEFQLKAMQGSLN